MLCFLTVILFFQYHRELDRMMTGEWCRRLLAQGVIQFSIQWIRLLFYCTFKYLF